MKRYLIQARNITTGDPSHSVIRWTMCAENLLELNQKLSSCASQHEVDLLGEEEVMYADKEEE